jgi:hypothetical protein
MALQAQLQLNPYANFDPSQWSNPYSNYQSSALPGATYAGWPTNWQGQPISPMPGMTLNSSQPAAAAPAAAASPPSGAASSNPALAGWQAAHPPGSQISAGGTLPSGENYGSSTPTQVPATYVPQQQAAQGAATAPIPQSNSAGLTPQQYMQLRANPGYVQTPGATVPEGSSQPLGSGALQSFLSNWKPASAGPGSGFQQSFANSLKGMGY